MSGTLPTTRVHPLLIQLLLSYEQRGVICTRKCIPVNLLALSFAVLVTKPRGDEEYCQLQLQGCTKKGPLDGGGFPLAVLIQSSSQCKEAKKMLNYFLRYTG